MSEVVKVGKKGQITLPKEIREKEGLKKGQLLEVKEVGGGSIFLTSIDRKKEADAALRLLGKNVKMTDKEVVEYCRKIREEVFQEWSES
ncbi:hypothetical protein AKJ47_02225 [candidate division MSBL1 archaeon SCGC-AAA261G05]|uniref:SpoVT-AbrB domain-containing protein n=2 Tax=candidate division MSBL1 TaxID=215777 RepID=A0A133VAG3_9EURY|nr:hypothetical protein AKJ47_02225 [candidate division MSBL1 archaeon SCGC-AAA261G05]KXB04777.1 hypothetical protein AKJ48_01415 [candidate division MSBL1 archaeon SCGC-AAA261O19]